MTLNTNSKKHTQKRRCVMIVASVSPATFCLLASLAEEVWESNPNGGQVGTKARGEVGTRCRWVCASSFAQEASGARIDATDLRARSFSSAELERIVDVIASDERLWG